MLIKKLWKRWFGEKEVTKPVKVEEPKVEPIVKNGPKVIEVKSEKTDVIKKTNKPKKHKPKTNQ